MRLILRHQNVQSKIEGREPFCADDKHDYSVVVDGPVVGRIYRQPGSKEQWRWVIQKGPYANGYSPTLEEAKAEFAKAYKPEDAAK
jgi:hypothetical protein